MVDVELDGIILDSTPAYDGVIMCDWPGIAVLKWAGRMPDSPDSELVRTPGVIAIYPLYQWLIPCLSHRTFCMTYMVSHLPSIYPKSWHIYHTYGSYG